MNDLRLRVHRHVLSLSASFFDRTPVGRLMTRMTNDIESLNEMFASGIVSLLGDVVRLVAHPDRDVRDRLAAGAVLDGRGAGAVRASPPTSARWVRDAFREIRVRWRA